MVKLRKIEAKLSGVGVTGAGVDVKKAGAGVTGMTGSTGTKGSMGLGL